ncbi:hypothetical protein [Nonomuraea jabiensis]|uniref:Uncharacterized protein n=1 Tax=Nonomuraea jabiensis TaxID=882448 RepID=A0A7W9GC63_9ACTN|nr:hypothetical protein [Nonomuraea jabiensis]MBB5781080.1 hypothetical protein [Nonomuraea jabiensis]
MSWLGRPSAAATRRAPGSATTADGKIHYLKCCLREGLLPPGERTGRNQALLEVGGLSVASVQATLVAIDEQVSTHTS